CRRVVWPDSSEHVIDCETSHIRLRCLAMKNRKRDIRSAAAMLGRIGGKAGTGVAKARTSKQARAAVMNRWQPKCVEYETANGNVATQLTSYGRQVAKRELLEILQRDGPCRTSKLSGTPHFHGHYTLSLATVRTLLNELQEAGQVRSEAGGQGTRTYLLWARQ